METKIIDNKIITEIYIVFAKYDTDFNYSELHNRLNLIKNYLNTYVLTCNSIGFRFKPNDIIISLDNLLNSIYLTDENQLFYLDLIAYSLENITLEIYLI